jgi:C-terminal processing protease CtpA/Prc
MKTRLIVIIGIMAAGLTALAYYAVQPGNIGIGIARTNAGEPLHIVSVFPGSPAEDAGIKTNWFIISVDGTNVVSAPSERCMSIVHGTVGTSVTLELVDPQRNQTNRFTIKRADVRMSDDLFHGMFGPGSETNAPKPIAPKSVLIAQ